MSVIIGNPTVTPMAIPDWNQTNSTKADYIKNKPDVYTKEQTESLFENMCKYKGVVETFDDLPYEVTFEVTGAPYMVVDGVRQDIGSYNSSTGVVSFDKEALPSGEYVIKFPVNKKTIESGYYACGRIDFGNITGLDAACDEFFELERYIGEYTKAKYIPCDSDIAFEHEEQDIDVLTVSVTKELGLRIIDGSGKIVAHLSKVVYQGWMTPHESLSTGHIYKVLDSDTNYIWNGTEWDALGGNTGGGGGEIDDGHINNTNNPHRVTASQVGAYTKSEVDNKLKNKANKEDIVSAYKFCGSVDKFEDLYTEYKIVPNGVPTYKGELWGTFENGYFSVNPIEDESWMSVDIPIEEITLKKGYYVVKTGDIQVSGAISWINIYMGGYILEDIETFRVIKIDEDTVISGATIAQHSDGCLNSATGTLVCTFCKVDDEFIEENGDDYQLKSDDCMPQTGDVYNVIADGMNYAWTGAEWDALGGEHKDIEAREQIAEINVELEKKANKEDVVSAYTFKGSVETFDDLPKCYEFVPCGNPTVDGVEVGTFDAKNRTITLNEPMVLEGYVIRVPIIDVNVAKGSYCISTDSCPDLRVLDAIGYTCYTGYPLEVNAKTTITEVYIGYPFGEYEHSGTCKLGELYKFRVDEYGHGDSIYINNGDIYEVKESGLNYGWTGSTWDALGTSHVDQEARSDIEVLQSGLNQVCSLADEADSRSQSNMHDIAEINTQIGDIETALDAIIEIQNGLIGGEAE